MLASEAVQRYGGTDQAARALNLNTRTFRRTLKREQAKLKTVGDLTFEELPERHEPIHELLDRLDGEYRRKRQYTDAANWQKIHIADNLPIGVVHMGDPHMDDDGCNRPLLRRHVQIIRDTEGCYALNVGDYTNNWVGRLARLFAKQETSQSTARRLVEWLLVSDYGLNGHWLAVVLGNHDEWNEGGEIIKLMAAKSKVHIPVHEWCAKIELRFPNKANCRISAAHDFKGRSQFSAVHGLRKEAIWQQDGTHIYVAGHIHFGEVTQFELPGGFSPWLIRVRGYKEMDSFALVNGFHEGRRFASVMTIIDPNAPEESRVLVFTDIEQGARVLSIMRAAARTAQTKKQKQRATSKRRSRTTATRAAPAKKSKANRRQTRKTK